MNKQELIEKFNRENKELKSTEASCFKLGSKTEELKFTNRIMGLQLALNWARRLNEPQKAKVPLHVGNWIEYSKDEGWDFFRSIEEMAGPMGDGSVRRWFRKNSDKYAEAWSNDFEVEEEPKYQVKLKFGRQYLSKNSDGTALDFYACMHPIPSFSKSELSEIEDGAFYKADGDKEWINPIIELVPVEKV